MTKLVHEIRMLSEAGQVRLFGVWRHLRLDLPLQPRTETLSRTGYFSIYAVTRRSR